MLPIKPPLPSRKDNEARDDDGGLHWYIFAVASVLSFAGFLVCIVIAPICLAEYARYGVSTADTAAAHPDALKDATRYPYCRTVPWGGFVAILVVAILILLPCGYGNMKQAVIAADPVLSQR
jgi:hypothetical protein